MPRALWLSRRDWLDTRKRQHHAAQVEIGATVRMSILEMAAITLVPVHIGKGAKTWVSIALIVSSDRPVSFNECASRCRRSAVNRESWN